MAGRKVEYIKTLAEGVVEKKIDFEEFKTFSNEEIITRLTALKSIGRWTDEMYLFFSLGRENVLSKGDGTIRRTIQWMYDLEDLPSSKELAKCFTNWNKYAAIVSSYLWKSISLGLTQKLFDEAISPESLKMKVLPDKRYNTAKPWPSIFHLQKTVPAMDGLS